MLTAEQREQYERDGFYVAKGLFSKEEVDEYIRHYMRLRLKEHPGDFSGVDASEVDPLKKYPRMIHMHRWDEVSLKWMIDARLNAVMTDLLGVEPYAVQTMLYFKPAGGRGQALHQDQFYLRVDPGTCMAAWMALDRCDEENGCLRVAVGSHQLPVLCTQSADIRESFTDVTVPIPDDMPVVPVVMDPGDVLFFNGSVIHGSLPNISKDRFRRALIGHYIVGSATEVSKYYHPALRMDGSVVELEASKGGGPCGKWVEQDGKSVVTLEETAAFAGASHG
jgi:phytanoyl-CoA hydroxylase